MGERRGAGRGSFPPTGIIGGWLLGRYPSKGGLFRDRYRYASVAARAERLMALELCPDLVADAKRPRHDDGAPSLRALT